MLVLKISDIQNNSETQIWYGEFNQNLFKAKNAKPILSLKCLSNPYSCICRKTQIKEVFRMQFYE